MKNKNILLSVIISLILILIINVKAEQIISNTLTIQINNNSIQIFNPFRLNDNNTFLFSYFNNSNNNSVIQNQNFTFNDLFIYNGTMGVVDFDVNSKLLDCMSLSSSLNTSLINCQTATSQLGNITSQLTVCQLDRRDRDNTIKNLQADKDALTLKTTGSSNNGIIWGLAGAGLTAVGFVVYLRMKRGESVGSKIKSEFSPLGAT